MNAALTNESLIGQTSSQPPTVAQPNSHMGWTIILFIFGVLFCILVGILIFALKVKVAKKIWT